MLRALLVVIAVAGGCTVENPFHGAVDLARGRDFAIPEFDFAFELPDLAVEAVDLAGRDLAGGDLAGRDLAGRDLSSSDLTEGDLAQVTATLNAIDTGQIPDGTNVVVSGVILTGIARFDDVTGSSMRCIYEAYAQDPVGVAPCGIRLFAAGQVCTAGCTCPFPPATGTPLDVALTLGERFTVSGFVDVFLPPTGEIIHSIQISSLVSTGSGAVAPIVFTSGTSFANKGGGYLSHESMLVRIQPAAPFTISTVGPFGDFTGAGAQFTGIYRFVYGAANTFPASSSTWASITGIAQPGFGGGIAPRVQPADFVPP